MIQAMIFDLDGTLVQTERLKALSYARAAVELCPRTLGESEVPEAYKQVVGLSRREVAQGLVERFDLEEAARARMAEFGVSEPWQAFVQVRLRYYAELLDDPDVLRASQWPHNVSVLQQARQAGCKVALATMSRCDQAQRILKILGLQEAFDFVATRDDVEHGKPDPEIYQLVAGELDVDPAQCLVLEDSPSGVQAALAAGMNVIAVSTPFTRERLRDTALLPPGHVVDDAQRLPDVIEHAVKYEFHDLGGSRQEARGLDGQRA
jgi:HAD superfamily hydrolase (TIGR01509 family)